MTTYVQRVRQVISAGGELADFAGYRDDPVALAIDVLGITPWSRQAEVLRAIASDARVAVRSGHKTGKSESLALAAIWYALTRQGARVVMTAPTARQVRVVLWKAIRRLCSKLPSGVVVQANDVPTAGIHFANGSELLGFTADNSEQFAGISGADLLFIVDEASGVESMIFEAIEGSAAGGALIVVCGNPTRTSGVFFDAFHDAREFWRCLHISSEETPNVIEGRIVLAGLATKDWVAGRRLDWGEQSALFAVRVKGDFPSQSSNAVVTLALLEAGLRRWSAAAFEQETARTTIGCDPARFGDDSSVIFIRRGFTALPPLIYKHLDGIQLAARVMEAARTHSRAGERVLINVDSIGIGASLVDALKAFDGIEVRSINAGESSKRNSYARLRDELWFGIAEWLKAGGALPDDSKLTGELVAVEYSFLPNGKIKVEGKDELRARLGRSPDRADALALAVYAPPRFLDLGEGPITCGDRRIGGHEPQGNWDDESWLDDGDDGGDDDGHTARAMAAGTTEANDLRD